MSSEATGGARHHAGDGRGGVGQDPRGQPVDPGDIGDAREQHQVGLAYIGPGVTGRGGGHDHLGYAEREFTKGPGRDGRTSCTAERERAVHPALGVQPGKDLRGALGHRGDGGATVARFRKRGQVGASRGRDLGARHVGGERRLVEYADVDDQGVHAGGVQAVPDERVLRPLRVERSDQSDSGHGHSPSRSGSTPHPLR